MPQLLCFLPRTLLVLFVEIDYWERLLFETPHYVMNVAERAEDLRILRENLLLVARDYNRCALSSSARACGVLLRGPIIMFFPSYGPEFLLLTGPATQSW